MTRPQPDLDQCAGLDGRYADLLRACFPLIHILRGDKQTWFRACWMRAAHGHAMQTFKLSHRALPESPKAVARALHQY